MRQLTLQANVELFDATACELADKVAEGFGITKTMHVIEHGAVDDLAELVFKTPGPTFAVAKIALSEDPWMLPEKDGAAIARRFRVALGLAQA